MNTAWKTVRVFISSTFLDMQAERDHLVRFVLPRLREQLLPHRLHLLDVDLRWGLTSEEDSTEVCRELITQSRHFLCMLGGRYGTIPKGQELSITADEVHFAVLDRPLRDQRLAHFYFRDIAATAAMVETTPSQFRELPGSDKQRKLTELKQAIVAAGLDPFLYPAHWDNDSRRLTGLKEFGDRVYDDLLASIRSDPELQDRFATDATASLDEFAEENAAMEAFVEERSERFVLGSRETVLEELLAHAHVTGGNGYLCLTGASGSGKSALLAHLSQHPSLDERSSTLLIRHFVGVSAGSTDVRSTLLKLCRELKARCPHIRGDIPDDPGKLPVLFPNFLRQACARQRVVILLDAVNQFNPASHSTELNWLPDELPENARVILSALEGPTLDELRRSPHKPREIELRPLTRGDGEVIVDQFSRRYRKKFEPEQREALLAKSDAGTPLYLLAALEELRTLGIYEEITQRIVELPSTTPELFTWILRRLENDDGFRDAAGRPVGRELVSHFTALLGASRLGLSQRELTDLLAVGDPQGNVAALLHLLRPYLMRRGELLDFYHDQFRGAATQASLKTDAQRQAAHVQLAHYFQDRRQEPYVRALSELPYHLAAGGLDAELLRLTSDAAYLEDCIAFKGIGFLLDCLSQARAALKQDSSALLPLAQELDVLQAESGSLAGWNREKRAPDLCNQLVNGATRRGYHGLFRRTVSSGARGFPGCVLLGWSLGCSDIDIKERLPLPGNRDAYAWDIYDYGPLSCKTQVWIDLARRRLLTDTVSMYGSQDAGLVQQTHEPREWDLETGALLSEHPSEADPLTPMVKEVPQAFADLSGLTTMRSCPAVPLSPVLGQSSAEREELIAIKAIGRAVNSEDTVFRVSLSKPMWTFGSRREESLWVYNPDMDHAYRTSHHATGLTIQAIVRIQSALTAFATDRDGHVYRLLLTPKEPVTDEPPVLDVASAEMPDEFACIISTSVQVRAVADNALRQAYRRDDLLREGSDSGKAPAVVPRHELGWTPDRRWLVINSTDLPGDLRVVPCEEAVALRDGVIPASSDGIFSARTGECLQREWAALPAPARYRDEWHNEIDSICTSRLGRYRLVKRRCSIDIWEVSSGRMVGSVGTGPRYGGGGNLYGIATHPSERFVISSDDENGTLAVWDLEKNLECWHMQGLGPLGKIHSLAFLWGGYLVAALTEEHLLYLLRFWSQSEIVAAIRVDGGARRIVGTPYGDSLFILYESGRLACYKYRPRPGDTVTTMEGNTLHVRFRSPGAKTVHIAGTFNDWSPSGTPLETKDGDHWQATVELPDGRHEYKLVIDGRQWEIDPNVPFVPREYGPNNYVDLPSMGPACAEFGCRA